MSRILGRELGGLGQPLGCGVELLLAQQQQADVGPGRRFVRRKRGDAFELPAREHFLAGLERSQPRVERDDRLPIGLVRDRRLAPARDRGR